MTCFWNAGLLLLLVLIIRLRFYGFALQEIQDPRRRITTIITIPLARLR
ncbi:MAG: hypothetical protein KC561_15960 [Myxococcales bacterium]|nr:hypothetical protein [Myxococcales bacterium]